MSTTLVSDERLTYPSVFAVWYEPTDADKACKPFLSESWKVLTYTSPNLAELCTMNRTLGLPTPTGASLFLCPVLQGSCTDGDAADKQCGKKQLVVEQVYTRTPDGRVKAQEKY